MGVLTVISLIFGFIFGDFLNRHWLSLISSSFFKVDHYFVYQDYLLVLAFAILTILVSLIPEAQSLYHQNLAKEIEEE